MTTALAAQLAQIRTKSTNSLDLKAQKKAHSQSLLFSSRVAATQDFDSIFQICHEGFEDLCRLDSRFLSFAGSIFSEQSKLEDRTQMNEAQNQQLDAVVEEFLGLVSSKLLLKPALKAVEWLVRKFRVHDHNPVSLVLAFLPYHTAAIFRTILSILPQTIPPQLRFLHPYIQSLANPPRHTIVYAASNSRAFLGAFCANVLKSGCMGCLHPALTSFWASVVTEAVASMLAQARSARRESQQQNQEDVILFLLPILNEGFSIDGVPDLRVGCYMILTILASKVDLDDEVIAAMMEAVTSKWEQTSHAGLICLSVLAQQRDDNKLPKKVFKALAALEGLEEDLATLRKQYIVDKLVLGMVLGVLNQLQSSQDISRLQFVRSLIEGDLLEEKSLMTAIHALLSAAQNQTPYTNLTLDIQQCLADLLLRLADSGSVAGLVQATIREHELAAGQIGRRLQRLVHADKDDPERMVEDVDIQDSSLQPESGDFESLTKQIPAKTAYERSFLSHSDSYVFGSLADAFCVLCPSSTDLGRFTDLAVLRKSLAMSEPLFLSFFIRFWCGSGPTQARAAAIRTVTQYLDRDTLTIDVQVLLPYLLYALADPSHKIRRAASELVLFLSNLYSKAEENPDPVNVPILGHEQIYGDEMHTGKISWLTTRECNQFISRVLVPGMEECLLDNKHISQLLSDNLNGSKPSKGSKSISKHLKTSQRVAILTNLCSHVVNTPMYAVKLSLLQMLDHVNRVGSTSRSKLLLPLLSEYATQSEQEHDRICEREKLDPVHLLDQMIGIVTSADREGIQTLRNIIEPGKYVDFPSLKVAALRRIRIIWVAMKSDLQLSFARDLLDQGVGNTGSEMNNSQEVESLEILRQLPLSTTILQAFVEELPSISVRVEDLPSAPKRRRTSHGASVGAPLVQEALTLSIKQITLVLELVEDARPERHPELLKGLHQVVYDLQHAHDNSKAATDYLLVLSMDCMLAIINGTAVPASPPIDYSIIRTNVLIDCIRTTRSPQVRNSALLLVAALATVTPELVLHSLMPIFTFMGANLLRQDDDFSAYVVKQTMESIIPCLLSSLRKGKGGPFTEVSKLLLSFAAAFKHIPPNRRLDLFISLANRVDPSEYLFALLVILMDKYPGDREVLHFSTGLVNHYDVENRLRTMQKYLEVILDAWSAKPSLSASLITIDNERTVDSATENLLPLASSILGDEAFAFEVKATINRSNENATAVRNSYAQTLQQIFLLSEQVRQNPELIVLCMEVLNASLGVLPLPDLIGTLKDLLEQRNENVRRQVLGSFADRLSEAKSGQREAQEASLAFLPQLLLVIRESEDVTLKQTAVTCVDRIAEKFGKKDTNAVASAAVAISGEDGLGAAQNHLRIASLICLATVVEVTGEGCISIIPGNFSRAMDLLTESIEEDADDTGLHNAVYTFMSSLLLYVPWMISATDLDRFLSASWESANAEMGAECDQGRIEALRLVPKQIAAREFLSALKRTFSNAMAEGPLAIKEYLEILRLAIDRHPKSVIAKQSQSLGDLFLMFFDFRRLQLSPPTDDSYTVAEIEEVEEAVNESAIVMVYKLNDATFRPLFIQMSEWANGTNLKKDKGLVHRQTTWYTFLLKFFDALKSIVTNYAGYILDQSVDIINSFSSIDEESTMLWTRVIMTLHKTFEHDQDDFYQSPSHFSPVSTALLSQLAKAADVPLLPELIPAIAELAVATDSSTHHKEMNTAILQHIRSDNASIRLAAVQCERALTTRLGEEWLALLPEMLPFISEAMEDDDEVVEREVQRWVVEIEEILGESLNPMLQ